MDKVFGILYDVPPSYFKQNTSSSSSSSSSDEPLPSEQIPLNIKELADKRIECKLNKKFDEADAIRVQLASLGYEVKDVKGGGYNVYNKSKL